MKFIRKWSYSCAHKLSKELSENHQKKAIYYYGFQVVIGSVVKGTVLVFLAAILGILKETLITLAFFASLRVIAGGYHMSTYGRCMVTSMAILIGEGFIVKYTYQYWTMGALIIASIIIYLAGIISILKWAPADTPNKRITDRNKRKKLMVLSCIHINLWLAANILLSLLSMNLFAVAGCFGIFLAVLIITPAGYSFFGLIEGKRGNATFTNMS